MSAGGLRLREFDGLQLHHDSTFGFQPSESQTTQPTHWVTIEHYQEVILAFCWDGSKCSNINNDMRRERDFILIPTHFYPATTLQLLAFA